MEGEKGIVCVTGGTGYIASWLIMKLLQQDYSVRATIRDCEEDFPGCLTNLQGASKNLKIFKADLDKPDSFDAAIAGCVGVFHVAHPTDIEVNEPEEVITRRTVEGTLGILKACMNSKTVKRVVLTSSAAAVISKEGLDIVDENSWADIDYYRSLKIQLSSYAISKTLVEKAALEFADQHGLDIVTVLPSCVLGPFITPNLPGSVSVALAMISGKAAQWLYSFATHMVHVDDLVSAHIFLLDCPNAKGRYICSSHHIKIDEMVEFISSRYTEVQLATPESLREIIDHGPCSYSSKKLLDLGFKFKYSPADMYDGAIQCCKKRGFL